MTLNIVILGLSITSSWGNGHATTYRGLVRELSRRGHAIAFLERDVPWYASNRDLPNPPYGETYLYQNIDELRDSYTTLIKAADVVIVGSYVPEGVTIGEWVQQTALGVTVFYDIDTPVTLAKLARGDMEYLAPHLIPHYDLYLSFSGGPVLRQIEQQYGSPQALPLYCSVDPELYYPDSEAQAHPSVQAYKWDLGYMGTYSPDRQPGLEELLLEPARQWPDGQMVVAGPQYPSEIDWPSSVQRIEHLPPAQHREFYTAQRFTLNLTRTDMIRVGYSPSVRLFEAAACATPIISDYWVGLETIFTLGTEILVARSAQDVLSYLRDVPPDVRHQIGQRARQRVLSAHTAAHRAAELEQYLKTALATTASSVALQP